MHFFSDLAIFGCIVVVFGVVLEGAEHLVKFKSQLKCRRWVANVVDRRARTRLVLVAKYLKPNLHKFEAIGFLILVGGLAMEILGEFSAGWMQSRENAQLENTNYWLTLQIEELRSNNIALETELRGQDPYKQPITSLSATVSFTVMEPNGWRPEADSNAIAELIFCNRTNINFPKIVFVSHSLKCNPIDPNHLYSCSMRFDFSEFKLNEDIPLPRPMLATVQIQTIGENVEFVFNSIDSVCFRLPIKNRPPRATIPGYLYRADIGSCDVTLVLNNVPRHFGLPGIGNFTNSIIVLTNNW